MTASNSHPLLQPTPATGFVAVAGSQPGEEIRRVLLRRLRILLPFLLIVCGFYFLRNLVGQGDPVPREIGILVQGSLILGLLAAAMPLFLDLNPSLSRLRQVEVGLIGLSALFLAWRHCCTLCEAWEIKESQPQSTGVILRLAIGTTTVRWLLFLLAYAVLIPNSVRRCAVGLLVIVLLPLAITLSAALSELAVPLPLLKALVQMGSILTAGAALGLFVCARLNQEPAEIQEGSTLGVYFLQQRLSVGGMGEIYHAWHLHLRRACAVKRIRPEFAHDPQARQRFEREARAMASLHHPNIAAVFDAGQAVDGTVYYAMEFIPGRTLGELVEREGPLAPARAIRLLRQLAGALEAAHTQGFLHLDITPRNVLVTGQIEETLKLLDFGLVGVVGNEPSQREAGIAGGSPGYMSPEQSRPGAFVGVPSDIYGLGALAYFLLSGQPPFVRDNALQTLLAHTFDEVIPLQQLRPGVPLELDLFVLRCLAKEPVARYESMSAVGAALDHCLRHSSTLRLQAETPAEMPTLASCYLPAKGPPNGLVHTPFPDVQLTDVRELP